MNTDAQSTGQDPIQDPAQTTPTATKPEGMRSPVRQQPRPRTGPIVWGALILAFCGYVAQRTIDPAQADTTVWITATVIGLGLLLLGVGTAVLFRNRGR